MYPIFSIRFWFRYIPFVNMVKFYLLHNSQWITFPIQSYLVFFYQFAVFAWYVIYCFIWHHIIYTMEIVTLYGWSAKQMISLSVLARNQTKDFWTWNLAVSGSGKGTRKRIGWIKELRSSWRRDSREASQQKSWRGTTDRAVNTGHQSSETNREDRVQRRRSSQEMSAFQLLYGISLVTHASVSLHMHVVLHTLLLLWVNPKHCSCLFIVLLFPPAPSIVFLSR